MTAARLDTFGGMIPAVDDRLLGDRASAHSENTWLYSGRISGIPQPELVRANTAGTGKVFRIPSTYTDGAHIANSTWMEFANPDTDVVKSMVVGDTYDRYYWASSTAAPRYNTLARIIAGSASWLLGLPAPAAVSIICSGGVGVTTSRSYVTTWVSTYGEEGPASLPLVKTGKVDDTWTLTLTAAAAGDLGTNRTIAYTNIYRTVTSSAGVATYFFVAQVAVGTLSYADSLSDTTVSANNIITSTNWIAPPTDLAGFVQMPNGILAGFRSNEIWFCEPFRPHAWPAAYALTVDFPIVGLGVSNQTLIVCTQGYPVTISGIHPSAMSQATSKSLEPCMSRGSILSTTDGVYYASPNGLVAAAQGTIANITRDFITKDRWAALVAASSIRAARLGTAYYGFGSSVSGSFDPLSFDPLSFAQSDFAAAYSGFLIDPQNQSVAFNLMSDTTPITAVQNDQYSGDVYVIKNDNTYRINLANTDPIRTPYIWRSKIFQMKANDNLGALKVYWETPTAAAPDAAGTPPFGALDAVEFPALPVGSTYGVVRAYADGVLVLTRDLVTSGEMIRMPSGFKANFYQFEIESYLTIYSIQFASSARELKGV